MNNLKVTVLMGGQSAERAVSLLSGEAVCEALKQLGHTVYQADGLAGFKHHQTNESDVVFNILHGADGEDGQLAAWLNLEGHRNTSVNYSAASLSWHKDQAKALVKQAGLNTPDSQLLKQASDLKINDAGPWVIKPATEGSSVGLFKANDESSLKSAVERAFLVADEILVETFIAGIECTVGVVGNDVLPVVSIVPAQGLYDYAAKYESNDTQYHCPANFDLAWQAQLQTDARIACQALGLQGWCRVDFIVDQHGQSWFLEVNTTPGMTSHSLLPKAAAVHGWNFRQLVEQILKTAFNNSQSPEINEVGHE